MAIIQNADGLGFEFRFWRLLEGRMQYRHYFLWQGEPMIRDSLLSHEEGTDWEGRPPNAWMADDDRRDECGLIRLLRQVLSSDKYSIWINDDDTIRATLYPFHYTPCLGLNPIEGARESDILREPEQKSPSDAFTLIVWVDACNFKKFRGHNLHGPMLHLHTDRSSVERFLADLEREYAEFRSANATEFDE